MPPFLWKDNTTFGMRHAISRMRDLGELDSKIRFRDSRFGGIRGFGNRGFRDSRIRGFEDSGIRFEDSRIRGFEDSRIRRFQGFEDSRIRGSEDRD
jgi:hypothetical protein